MLSSRHNPDEMWWYFKTAGGREKGAMYSRSYGRRGTSNVPKPCVYVEYWWYRA